MRPLVLVILLFTLATAAGATSVPTARAAAQPEDPCPIDENGNCLSDRDGDGRSDSTDNCPDHWNPGQEDNDGDGFGNACDPTPNPDRDGDGVPDDGDNCPDTWNPGQENTYGDWRGDACEQPPPPPDRDGDGIADHNDNCPDYYSTNNRCDADPYEGGGAEEEMPVRPSSWTYTDFQGGTHTCTWKRVARRQWNNFWMILWKYHVKVDYCWNATALTKINVRVWPEMLYFCCWEFARHVTLDARDAANDPSVETGTGYYANWGRTSFNIFAQGAFDYCLPRDWGLCLQRLPWVDLTVHRGGRSFHTSGGT